VGLLWGCPDTRCYVVRLKRQNPGTAAGVSSVSYYLESTDYAIDPASLPWCAAPVQREQQPLVLSRVRVEFLLPA
jgi:hypothetical protein